MKKLFLMGFFVWGWLSSHAFAQMSDGHGDGMMGGRGWGWGWGMGYGWGFAVIIVILVVLAVAVMMKRK
jgi:hypothetical protein